MGDSGSRLAAIRNLCQRYFQHTWAGRDYTERSIYHSARQKRPLAAVGSETEVSDDATSRRASKPPPWYRNPPTVDELKSLVEMYDMDGYGAEKQENEGNEENDRKAGRDSNSGSEDPQELHTPQPQDEWDSDTYYTRDKLVKLLRQARPDSHAAFELYKSLPYPRVAYLDYNSVRQFLNCLAWVERKNEASMTRYLSVIDDMKACDMPIALADWSTAIHFVGQCFRKVGDSEIESALYVWREMEHESGVRGNRVTFSILFDIAAKAGKHRLVDMILKEMESRKLKFDRHFHVSFIHYQGLRGDGDAVRKAYVNLVDSGAIVDTVVLNCVMTALITAGELPAAEQVFAGMKDLHKRGEAKSIPRHWSKRREIGKLLTRASLLVKDPEERALFQKATPIGPDHATFKILIKYHTMTSGNIDRISELLYEMGNEYQILPNGDLYYTLFHGFHHHGGIPYSSWTLVKLEELWAAYRNAIYNGIPDFEVDKAIAKAIILAFEKVVGGDRTWEVWEELKSMWKSPNAADLEEVNDRLMWLLQKRRGTDGVLRKMNPGWDVWHGRNHRSR